MSDVTTTAPLAPGGGALAERLRLLLRLLPPDEQRHGQPWPWP